MLSDRSFFTCFESFLVFILQIFCPALQLLQSCGAYMFPRGLAWEQARLCRHTDSLGSVGAVFNNMVWDTIVVEAGFCYVLSSKALVSVSRYVPHQGLRAVPASGT